MRRLQQTSYGVLLAAVMLLAACTQSNPLLGTWSFQAYRGGGQLGSFLGGLATQFTQGTTVKFTPNAMIVTEDGEQHEIAVDHYDVKGNTVTAWVKTAPDHMDGQTYRIAQDGQSMSREFAGTGIREVFVRARKV